MITIQIYEKDVRKNQKRVKQLIKLLPKKAYYHFLFEPQLIIRVHNKDKHYITDYLNKKKLKYITYRYPFSKRGYNESKKSMTYIYRDEFVPFLHIASRLALKSKRKEQIFIIERLYHTLLNSFGYSWEYEASITTWLLAGRINTYKRFYGDGAIVSLLCVMILWNTRMIAFLLKGLR